MADKERNTVEGLQKILNKQSSVVVGLTHEGLVRRTVAVAQRMVREGKMDYVAALMKAQNEVINNIVREETLEKTEAINKLKKLTEKAI